MKNRLKMAMAAAEMLYSDKDRRQEVRNKDSIGEQSGSEKTQKEEQSGGEHE